MDQPQKRECLIALPTASGRATMGIALMMYEAALLSADAEHPWVYRPIWLQKFRPAAFARNLAVTKAMEIKADRVLFVDDDMPPPRNWPVLLEHDDPIVAGSYLGWQGANHMGQGLPPTVIPQTYMSDGRGGFDAVMREDRKPFVVDAAGTGALVISREVFEAVSCPWFLNEPDPTDGHFVTTEDLYFFRKANAAGFRVLVDPTVRFRHLKDGAEVHDILEYARAGVKEVLDEIRNRRIIRTATVDARRAGVLR